MKLLGVMAGVLLCHFVHAQTTRTISYSNIPSYAPQGCFFNNGNPSTPINIGNIAHVRVVGGVDYTGSEFVLNLDNTGAGTGFGMYVQFDQNHSYQVVVLAKATTTTAVLAGVASPSSTAISSTSCSPGPANTVFNNPDKLTKITNMGQTYSLYSVLDNYIPSTTGVNYLLFSAYNTVGSIGNVQIQAVYFTSTPLNCPAPTITNVTAAAVSPNINFTATFAPPNPSTSVSSYRLEVVKCLLTNVGFGTQVLNPIGVYAGYDNISTPFNFAMSITDYITPNIYYAVRIGSMCNGEYKYTELRRIK